MSRDVLWRHRRADNGPERAPDHLGADPVTNAEPDRVPRHLGTDPVADTEPDGQSHEAPHHDPDE